MQPLRERFDNFLTLPLYTIVFSEKSKRDLHIFENMTIHSPL